MKCNYQNLSGLPNENTNELIKDYLPVIVSDFFVDSLRLLGSRSAFTIKLLIT